MGLPLLNMLAGNTSGAIFRAGVGSAFALKLRKALQVGDLEPSIRNLGTDAGTWAESMSAYFLRAFGEASSAVWPYVKFRFLSELPRSFSGASEINIFVTRELPGASGAYAHLWLFFLWVGAGIDARASVKENAATFDALFDQVMLAGVTDAGLDSLRLTGSGEKEYSKANIYDANSTYIFDPGQRAGLSEMFSAPPAKSAANRFLS